MISFLVSFVREDLKLCFGRVQNQYGPGRHAQVLTESWRFFEETSSSFVEYAESDSPQPKAPQPPTPDAES